MPREKSAGAIIYRREPFNTAQGKKSEIFYLLLYVPPSGTGKRGQWGFAKGHVEQGETEVQTARREIFEETGLKDLKILPGFKELEKYFFRKNYGLEGEARKTAPWVFKLVVFFIAETETKEIKISDEHAAFLWLPFAEALKRTTFKDSKKLLARANSFITSLLPQQRL
jgi:8-oxo-dGTP pyrophosphatase MutT (NUDIX family)